ncbi:MAG TPA: hypothetical protein VGA01_00120 [Candidatus Binatia bacterium]
MPEIILGTITGDTIGSTAGAPGMVITGPAIGIHIALRLAIVMITTVDRGGMTEDLIGRGIGLEINVLPIP